MTKFEPKDPFYDLLDRYAEDEGQRHGGIDPDGLPEDHLLFKPTEPITTQHENHRGTRLYRVGRAVAAALDHLFSDVKGRGFHS